MGRRLDRSVRASLLFLVPNLRGANVGHA